MKKIVFGLIALSLFVTGAVVSCTVSPYLPVILPPPMGGDGSLVLGTDGKQLWYQKLPDQEDAVAEFQTAHLCKKVADIMKKSSDEEHWYCR